MVKLSTTADIGPVDISEIPALIEAIFDRLRALDFDHGSVIHPQTGIRHDGLRNASNSHPRVGSRYIYVTERPEPSEPVPSPRTDVVRRVTEHSVAEIELVEDSRKAIVFHATTVDDIPVTARLHIDRRSSFRQAELRLGADIVGHWFIRGALDGTLRLDLDNWGSSTSVLTGTFRHRRARGKLDVAVNDDGLGRWTASVVIGVRGAGWIRPLAAIVGVVARRPLERALFGGIDDDDESKTEPTDELRELLDELAERTPAAVADDVVADIVTAALVTLPISPTS